MTSAVIKFSAILMLFGAVAADVSKYHLNDDKATVSEVAVTLTMLGFIFEHHFFYTF